MGQQLARQADMTRQRPVRMPLAHIRDSAFKESSLDGDTCMQGLTAGCVASPAKNRVPATGAPSAALSPGSAPAAACRNSPLSSSHEIDVKF